MYDYGVNMAHGPLSGKSRCLIICPELVLMGGSLTF